MARLNFPASPTDGQSYASDSGGTYVWDSDKTKWSRAVGPAYATLTGTQTLTNKTLTSPTINITSDAKGDIYYRDSDGNFTRLAIGSTDQVLKVSSGLPSWGAGGASTGKAIAMAIVFG